MTTYTVTEQQFEKACADAATQITLAVMNYRATDGAGPPGVRFVIMGQADLPPKFTYMMQGIIARHVRALLDGKQET